MADIEFQNVRKVFGDQVVALEEFSLKIPSPTLVVLVGRSASDQPSAVIALVVMLVLALGSEHLLLKRRRAAG